MLTDPARIEEVKGLWLAVTNIAAALKSQPPKFSVVGDRAAINSAADIANMNLPFVLAYGALDCCLSHMIDEGLFKCRPKALLGAKLLAASANGIAFVDPQTIEEGKTKRNETVHREGTLHSNDDCERYIHAIGDQLKAWGVIQIN